jgi:hypothetical protein
VTRGRVDLGVALLALVAASPRAHADRCAPTARITGTDAVTSLVATELHRLGVALGAPGSDCPGVDVQVRGDGHDGVIVTLRDGDRTDERALGAPAVAAAWIDAWLRDDLDWRAEASPPSAAPITPTPTPASATPVAARRVAQLGPDDGRGPADQLTRDAGAADTGFLARTSFAAGYEQGFTGAGAGAAWHGFGVAGCARSGAWCLGGRARFATQTFATGATGVARDDTALLATAAYGVSLGQLAVAPEVGVGVGRMSTSRAEPCQPPPESGGGAGGSDGSDPTQPPMAAQCSGAGGGTFVGDNLSVASYTPRGAIALRIAVPLFAHVWLDGIASASIAPFGHGDLFPATKPPPPGSGVMPSQLALPGEPLASFQLGIGLRVGAM